MSWYLTIRSDPDYSRFTATAPLVEFLLARRELRQTGPVSFEAAEGHPWVAVILAACSEAGNYNSDGAFVPRVNVVELVCSYSGDSAWYYSLGGKIARFLDWSAFEDHEVRQVWPIAEQNLAKPDAAANTEV